MGRNKDPSKPRGRMSSYAYFVQTCREEHKKKHPGESVVFTEFTKKCAEKWKEMSQTEKKRFEQMAEKDRARYDREMKNYTPPAGEKAGKKRRSKKDPNAPKRALSAFFFFCGEERSKVKEANPSFSVADVAKALGKKWETCKTKAKYEEMARKDKLRYEKENEAYKKKAAGASPAKKAKPAQEEEDDDDDDEEDDDDDEEDDS